MQIHGLHSLWPLRELPLIQTNRVPLIATWPKNIHRREKMGSKKPNRSEEDALRLPCYSTGAATKERSSLFHHMPTSKQVRQSDVKHLQGWDKLPNKFERSICFFIIHIKRTWPRLIFGNLCLCSYMSIWVNRNLPVNGNLPNKSLFIHGWYKIIGNLYVFVQRRTLWNNEVNRNLPACRRSRSGNLYECLRNNTNSTFTNDLAITSL
jgi:hypothetical protein